MVLASSTSVAKRRFSEVTRKARLKSSLSSCTSSPTSLPMALASVPSGSTDSDGALNPE